MDNVTSCFVTILPRKRRQFALTGPSPQTGRPSHNTGHNSCVYTSLLYYRVRSLQPESPAKTRPLPTSNHINPSLHNPASCSQVHPDRVLNAHLT
ncbi:unnamed protein product [Mesocestoides corti]|uniref:Uncharacterized protein n=1 Tax=Mesocestoides corti TaxID=53468 RepID=A0A3P6I012_MESCO|nr:unnamed protein product [Mesocestoides corti]